MAKVYPDISHHHPVQNWDKFAAAVGFAISKATEGTSFVDSTLNSFIKECEAKHIPYWLYAYLRRGNELAQTKFLVKTCKEKVGPWFRGYILDAEENNEATNVRTALDWLNTQSAKTMLYTGYADYSRYKSLVNNLAENCVWWEARYGVDDGTYNSKYPCHSNADLHQYSSNGDCPGIPDKIDVNRLTGTVGIKWFTDPGSGQTMAEPAEFTYPGSYPSLPSRGYYCNGDGLKAYIEKKAQIKNMQRLVNWITGGNIVVDGKFGRMTEAEVMAAQKILGVKEDGLFGSKTLMAAKAYRK